MANKYKSITGMSDILPDEVSLWQQMENSARIIFQNYGYEEIRVPILEETSLFARGIGENSQVVQKEMYTFDDKGGDSVTMRPEGTAGVIRAFVEHSLHAQNAITKLYYLGPMFRYERPQKGRLRQFHQIGAELIGVDSPIADAELVIMIDRLIQQWGIRDYQLEINSIGTIEERKDYINDLVAYFSNYKHDLEEDDLVRLDKNPLRLFDSKNNKCQELCQNAPLLLDALGNDSKRDFELFQKYLSKAGVAFKINPFIVRGLDYYEKTSFEFTSKHLGAQSAFVGGGRFNHLVHEIGGPNMPAIGFAVGCERVVMLLQELAKAKQEEAQLRGIYFAPMSESCFEKSRELLQTVRDAGIKAEMDFEIKSLKSQMRRANKFHFAYVGIMGDDELSKGSLSLKSLKSGEQQEIPFDKLVAEIG